MTARREKLEELMVLMKEHGIGKSMDAIAELTDEMMPKAPGDFDRGERCAWGQEASIGRDAFAIGREKVIQGPDFLSAHFLTEGAQIQKAVAMVTLKVHRSGLPAGSGWGTGFMISNSLFMTNNHVIESSAECNDFNVQFMYQENYTADPVTPEFFEIDEASFFHTNAALDYTIVRLKRKPYRLRPIGRPLPVRPTLPATDPSSPHDYADSEQVKELEYLGSFIKREAPISALDPSRIHRIFGYTAGSKYGHIPLRASVTYPQDMKLNVIQHPQGRRKEVVVQENELSDVYTNVIHYTSDTDYGSSGSPVFNNTWDLMALHHARVPNKAANEGIRIDIVADLRSEFQTADPGILTELGI
jgi:hypothetical protein